jgi:molybdenum cofactor biosynthesis enzyme MoaA
VKQTKPNRNQTTTTTTTRWDVLTETETAAESEVIEEIATATEVVATTVEVDVIIVGEVEAKVVRDTTASVTATTIRRVIEIVTHNSVYPATTSTMSCICTRQ